MMRNLFRLLLLLPLLAACAYATASEVIGMSVSIPEQQLNFTTIPHFRAGVSAPANSLSFTNLLEGATYEVRVSASAASFINGGNSIAGSNLKFSASAGMGMNNLSVSNFATNQQVPAASFLTLARWSQSISGGGTAQLYNPVLNLALACAGGANLLVPGGDGSNLVYGPIIYYINLYEVLPNATLDLKATANLTVSIGITNSIELVLLSSETILPADAPSYFREGRTVTKSGQLQVSSNLPFNLAAYMNATNLASAGGEQIGVGNIQLKVTTAGINAAASYLALNDNPNQPALLTQVSPAVIDQLIDISYFLPGGTHLLKPSGTYSGNLTFIAKQ